MLSYCYNYGYHHCCDWELRPPEVLFFDKLERERKDDIIVESRAKHFVLNDSEMRKIPWNGREIRNIFQTAVSLAEYRFHCEGGKMESDKTVLDKVDFEQVCQMSVEFEEYLTKVHKGDGKMTEQ
ncbi:hypothetical protein GGR58DRAFT_495475 [Xylaria digitata]|nr:hypothetical protein GGR58DRAFT_495475 [Xylaria digitata]